ncbi:MAG: carbon storage regulator [Mariprofundales bacterium]|nr:carbon storage regulator [Mariprofundales bacterium]
MLVIRRRIGEAIRINDDIRVVVQDVRHELVVRLGVDAPAKIPVHRLEIFELIKQENRAASAANVMDWLQGGRYVGNDGAK